MSRIGECFKSLRRGGRTALVPYITAGDPRPEETVALMHTMVESGADIIELGVPFSDPMADGPVIQSACERALEHGVTLENVVGMVADFRRNNTDIPVVLMGYFNPIEAMGVQKFAEAAAKASVDGVITVDLPPEEAQLAGMTDALSQAGIDPIFLLAPTSSEDRIQYICKVARGFIYYVSLKGVTGAGHLDSADIAEHLEVIRRYTSLPVAVGFGIKDATSAVAVSTFADAVVIGSALVDMIARHYGSGSGDSENCHMMVDTFLRAIRSALEPGVS